MKVIGINGSPRKNWNTATLLNKALEGAREQGAATELLDLYDFKFKGCISCFGCKRKGAKLDGSCVIKDELTPVLAKIQAADALVLGSPIYLMDVSSGMRALLERLLYPGISYDKDRTTFFPKVLPSGFIYDMGAPEKRIMQMNLKITLATLESFLGRVLGVAPLTVYSYDTYQFTDYAQYEASVMAVEKKKKWKEEQFPLDCAAAYKLGEQLVKQVKEKV